MTKTNKKHSLSSSNGARTSSGFSHKQKIKSPFSSQINKMKMKASSKKRKAVSNAYLYNQKPQEIINLERQIKMMQDKILLIERTQKRLQESQSSPMMSAMATTSLGAEQMSSRKLNTFEDEDSQPSTSQRLNCKRKRKNTDNDSVDDQPDRRAQKVAYIHVGEGGERDLEDHLRGSERVNIQIMSSERLPDIDASDMIHGLDSSGTSRDFVDDTHRCNVNCPVGCQGHLRPNEIIIYESIRYEGKLFGRKRIKGRFVTGDNRDDVVSLDMTEFRRIGGRSGSRRGRDRDEPRPARETERPTPLRRPHHHHHRHGRQRATRAAPSIPPAPSKLGVVTSVPQRLAILLDSPTVSRDQSLEHTWNVNDKSFNIVLKDDDPTVMRRHPIAQSTDCIRGKVGYTSGLHLWEISWPVRQRGTHAVIGVGTKDAPLHAVGYQSLVGNSDQTWGWDIGRLKVMHNNVSQHETSYYPGTVTHHHQWTVPETFNMILDMDQGSLGFVVGDQWLGWAVTGLKNANTPLYPIASTVWGHCEVKLKYLQGLEPGVLSLQDVVRSSLRDNLVSGTFIKNKDQLHDKIDQLPLPGALKNFVKFL